jgi:hypothetical protein
MQGKISITILRLDGLWTPSHKKPNLTYRLRLFTACTLQLLPNPVSLLLPPEAKHCFRNTKKAAKATMNMREIRVKVNETIERTHKAQVILNRYVYL